MSPEAPPLRFVVALLCEARPLIDHYRLTQDPTSEAFKLFRGDGVALVVSGIGKIAAAGATAYLQLAAGGGRDAAWLNVGVAGSGRRAVGEAVVAHKIVDVASGVAWYPPQLPQEAGTVLEGTVLEEAGTSDTVRTVDRAEAYFADDGVYDMEASGFYATACRFATAEMVQCLKVVSDGPAQWEAGPALLTTHQVTALVGDRLPWIAVYATAVRQRAAELAALAADPPELAELLARSHFTVSEARQLRRQLVRRRALAPDLPLPPEVLAEGGGKLLRQLARWLDSLPVRL